MSRIREYRFPTADALAQELSSSLAQTLRQAVADRGRATLAVSGGSTPLPLFDRLHDEDVPWSAVTVTLADERWVDLEHADSNAAFVHRELLVGAAAQAEFVALKNSATTPEDGEAACNSALARLPWPLDAVVLGMGDDGHTASLFPRTEHNQRALAEGLDVGSDARCVAIHPGQASHPRISLTLAALIDTRRLILHITGDTKWRVYEDAQSPGPVEDMPIRGVLRQTRQPVEVFWAP